MPAYPSPPGLRMAYDRDGSIPFKAVDGAVTVLSGTETQTLNTEQSGTFMSVGNGIDCIYGVVFPEKRDFLGYYCNAGGSNGASFSSYFFETSINTTNGIDGAWVSNSLIIDRSHGTDPTYRSAINSLVVAGITGIRARQHENLNSPDNFALRSIHLYGAPSAGQNPDSLRPWHPTIDQQADGTTLDFGDIPRSGTETLTFRIKNISSTKTAYVINVGMETLYDASPSIIGQFQLSTDNTNFFNAIGIGNLAPGTISPVIYCRDIVVPGAQLSVWDFRIVAIASVFA